MALSDMSLFSSTILSSLTFDNHDSGVSFKRIETKSGDAPSAMQTPHSEFVRDVALMKIGNIYTRTTWIAKVPATTKMK